MKRTIRAPDFLWNNRCRLGLPEDWTWEDCDAGCGNICWHDGSVYEEPPEHHLVFVCSPECALEWQRQNHARLSGPFKGRCSKKS